ncbi:hypothetical protein D9B85_00960 [Corynebacterium diphtheriae]|nr:hypothetical protein D9B85_00960 [Corynebacterium diphtheriae]
MQVMFYSPSGQKLFGENGSPAFLLKGGITDLKGAIEARTTVIPEVPGQVFDGVTIKPFTFDVTMVVYPTKEMPMEKAMRKTRQIFSAFDYSTCRIDGTGIPVGLKVRLDSIISAPSQDTAKEIAEEITITLAADEGIFWADRKEASGKIDIVNYGDCDLWPEYRWQKTTTITLPSGAKINLPETPTPRVLRTTRHQVSITDLDGKPDRELLKKLGTVWPEGVPRKETKTYEITQNGYIMWRIGYLDPWGL